MFRFIIVLLLIALGIYAWQNFNFTSVTKDDIVTQMQKEKTVTRVMNGRADRAAEEAAAARGY